MFKTGAATLIFAIWHSFLCSDGAKNGARKLLGERRGRALYRGFFMAQAAILTVSLFGYIWKQPARVLYEARGAKRFFGWFVQAASLAIALAAFLQFDKPKFLGVRGALDLQSGANLDEPQAQGPELDADRNVRARGVFRYSRHPLEWALALVFLATPKMKTNWLVFDILNALYSYLGALHEEKRLSRFSADYARYQKQVAFFFGMGRSESA